MSAAQQEVAEATSTDIAMLPPPQRAAVVLRSAETELHLQELAKASVTITTVTNPDGREQCHRALMTLRNTRTELQKRGKQAREDATKFGKAVIAEEDRLVGLISPEEARLQALRDAYDAEQERIKQEAIDKERARVEAIEREIEEIRGAAAASVGRSAEVIADRIREIEEQVISESVFQERTELALQVRDETLTKMRQIHADQVAAEAEIERKRQEQIAADEARRIEGERLAAERKRLEEERAEMDRARREQEERDRIERQRLADAQAELDRKAQDQADREQAERDRLAAEQRQRAEQATAELAEREAAQRRVAADAARNTAVSGINDVIRRGLTAETVEDAQAAHRALEAMTFTEDDHGDWVDDLRDQRDVAAANVADRIRQLDNIRKEREDFEAEKSRLANPPPPEPEPAPAVAEQLTAVPSDEGAGSAAAAPAIEEPAYPGDEPIEQAVAGFFGQSHLVARIWLRRYAEQVVA